MHKKTIRALLAAALLAGLVVSTTPAAAAQGRNPANGIWTATDPVDDSALTLLVTGGMSRGGIVVFDDRATVACPVADSPAVAFGRGSWSGDTLTVTVRIRCLGEPNPGPVPLTFVYDADSDTITSGAEVYSRR